MSSPTGENGLLPGRLPFSPVGLDIGGLLSCGCCRRVCGEINFMSPNEYVALPFALVRLVVVPLSLGLLAADDPAFLETLAEDSVSPCNRTTSTGVVADVGEDFLLLPALFRPTTLPAYELPASAEFVWFMIPRLRAPPLRCNRLRLLEVPVPRALLFSSVCVFTKPARSDPAELEEPKLFVAYAFFCTVLLLIIDEPALTATPTSATDLLADSDSEVADADPGPWYSAL
mmetsp:Transcript_13794/g.33958  ORF Transcript_13794/g.33958 Transcript_13794/m.33958 type:complete len:230 (-) Transcript_13794:1429-2118(-)